MPWSRRENVTTEWIDIDAKERFYLASDGRVWDSQEDVWYNHDYFDTNANNNEAELVIGPRDTLSKYNVRYIKRPQAIILDDLDGVTLDGKSTKQECELDPILHQEILQRAVELAKAAYTGDINSSVQMGQRSE